jgi:transposase
MQYKIEEKRGLVQGLAGSGLSKPKYAKEVGVSYGTFMKWCKQFSLCESEKTKVVGFVEVSSKRQVEEKSEIIIELEEIKIHLPIGAKASEIQTVLAAARQVLK